MPGIKVFNSFACAIPAKLYAKTPKAVLAAVAVSRLSLIDGASLEPDSVSRELLREWWTLYYNQIVPQKPPLPDPDL